MISRTSVALLAAFWLGPAFFTVSCARTSLPERWPLTIQYRSASATDTVDLFLFDTLGARSLDAYQQVCGQDVYALSCVGPRQLVALSGLGGDRARWAGIRTYGDLFKLCFSLDRDTPEHPLLAGQVLLEDGVVRRATLPLNTLLSFVRIRSVSCDFSGRPYARESFGNTLIYLQYAGTECRPLEAGDGPPVCFVNPGRLDSAAVLALPFPERLLQRGLGPVGPQRLYPGREFCCYANPVREAALGRPVTRLVLEGTVGKHYCYYPIELPGLEAGCRYDLDITLLRMGTDDPDIPAGSSTVRLDVHVHPWDIREVQTVDF